MECTIFSMPDHIILKILSFFTTKDICSVIRKVCKKWNVLSYDISLWKRLDLCDMADCITTWDKFHKAFHSICDKIEYLSFENCDTLFESDYSILWSSDETNENYNPSDTEKRITFNKLRKIDFGYLSIGIGFFYTMNICSNKFPSLSAISGVLSENVHELMQVFLSNLNPGRWTELNLTSDLNQNDPICEFTSQNIKLHSITLRNSSINDEELVDICKSCPNLSKLDLQGSHLIVSGITESAPYLSNLTDLNISQMRQDDEALIAISQHCPKLKHVNIGDCIKITEIGLQELVKQATNLESLLLNNNLSSRGTTTSTSLKEIGKYAKNLTCIQFANCENISSEGLCYIIKGCLKLEILDLYHCLSVTDEVIYALAKYSKCLRNLNTTGCTHLTSASISKLITHCPRLEHLELGTCHYIKDLDFSQWKILMQPNSDAWNGFNHTLEKYDDIANKNNVEIDTEIKTRDISTRTNHFNQQQEEDCSTEDLQNLRSVSESSLIFQLLQQTPSRLSSLDLSCCSLLSNGSLIHVAEYCLMLRHLNLRGCTQLTDSAIVSLVSKCLLLQALNISGTYECAKFTDKSITAIGTYSQNLVILSITKCPQITVDGVRHLIEGCHNLIRLSCSANTPFLATVGQVIHATRGSVDCPKYPSFSNLITDNVDIKNSRESDYLLRFPRLKAVTLM